MTGSTSAFKVITDKFKEGQSLHAYLLEPETDWAQATTTPVWLKEISFQKIGETLVLTALPFIKLGLVRKDSVIVTSSLSCGDFNKALSADTGKSIKDLVMNHWKSFALTDDQLDNIEQELH